jgi:K+/H+ antiporter YhaU regulatory subunit KhtT
MIADATITANIPERFSDLASELGVLYSAELMSHYYIFGSKIGEVRKWQRSGSAVIAVVNR